MRRVIIESPFANGGEVHVNYARKALLDSLDRGEAPLASHLLYPQVLYDTDPRQRELGILAGQAWQVAAEAIVVYADLGVSTGMRQSINRALKAQVPVEYRYIIDNPRD